LPQHGLDVPGPLARLEQRGQVVVGGDVAALLGGGPARRLDERDGLGRRLLRDVADDDVGPVGREGQRGGPPDPRGAARDEHDARAHRWRIRGSRNWYEMSVRVLTRM
jgi:hypothetical protein